MISERESVLLSCKTVCDGFRTMLMYYFLIGRKQEMDMFLEELHHVSERTHRDPGVIIISGGGGLGKTKLLRAMKAKAAMMGFR